MAVVVCFSKALSMGGDSLLFYSFRHQCGRDIFYLFSIFSIFHHQFMNIFMFRPV